MIDDNDPYSVIGSELAEAERLLRRKFGEDCLPDFVDVVRAGRFHTKDRNAGRLKGVIHECVAFFPLAAFVGSVVELDDEQWTRRVAATDKKVDVLSVNSVVMSASAGRCFDDVSEGYLCEDDVRILINWDCLKEGKEISFARSE